MECGLKRLQAQYHESRYIHLNGKIPNIRGQHDSMKASTLKVLPVYYLFGESVSL